MARRRRLTAQDWENFWLVILLLIMLVKETINATKTVIRMLKKVFGSKAIKETWPELCYELLLGQPPSSTDNVSVKVEQKPKVEIVTEDLLNSPEFQSKIANWFSRYKAMVNNRNARADKCYVPLYLVEVTIRMITIYGEYHDKKAGLYLRGLIKGEYKLINGDIEWEPKTFEVDMQYGEYAKSGKT